MSVTKGGTFEGVAIERGSERNGEITDYTFRITLKNQMPEGAVLEIRPPDEIAVELLGASYVQCRGGQNLYRDQPCRSGWDGVISTRLTLADEWQEQGHVDSGETFVIEILNMRNPSSLQRSSSFEIVLLDRKDTEDEPDYIISEEAEGMTVKNTEVSTIETPASLQAVTPGGSQETSLHVEFTPGIPLPSSAHIRIDFPESIITSGAAIECTGIDPEPHVADWIVRCWYDEDAHSVTIETYMASVLSVSRSLKFSIGGFRSPDDADEDGADDDTEPASFKITTYDGDMYRMEEME